MAALRSFGGLVLRMLCEAGRSTAFLLLGPLAFLTDVMIVLVEGFTNLRAPISIILSSAFCLTMYGLLLTSLISYLGFSSSSSIGNIGIQHADQTNQTQTILIEMHISISPDVQSIFQGCAKITILILAITISTGQCYLYACWQHPSLLLLVIVPVVQCLLS